MSGEAAAGAARPRVAVAAIVGHAGKVLLGQRLAPAVWQFPGGHLHHGESFFDCAERETREETGLRIRCRALGPVASNLIGCHHYVTVFVLAQSDAAAARVCEPDKCRAWQWFGWEQLPAPLFAPTLSLLAQGYDPLRELAALTPD